TGIGIEPTALARVFDAFEQGEVAASRRFGGLGLGLAICRSVIEAHGGRLTASSEGKDKGSRFSVELATADAAVAPAATHPGRHPESGPLTLKILLVEDNADTLRVMARLLRQRGYEVQAADSVASALA